tara:strand:- start:130 stop:1245 length:1116 start_codon:yes stop_codon:yes gene_type:complete
MKATARPLRFGIAALLVAVSLTTVSAGQSSTWLSGAQFNTRLKAPITLTWKQPLRDVIQSLKDNFSLCIFTDRRVDPDQLIELQVEDLSLEQTLRRLALTADMDMSLIRNVVYFGPTETTTLLATVAAIQAQNLKTTLTAPAPELLQAAPISWDRLANPRTILSNDASRLQLKYSNPESIAFDLWEAGQLAALPFAYRTTILLAGFGKTFEFTDNSTLMVIDFPQQATFQTRINRQFSPQTLARIDKQFPTLKIELNTNGLTVQGRWEEVNQLERLIRGGTTATTKPASKGTQVYTLTVENQSVKAIIQAIAQQEKLTVEASEQAQKVWGKRVSVVAKELRLNQLLSEVVGQAMLTFVIKDEILSIDIADN